MKKMFKCRLLKVGVKSGFTLLEIIVGISLSLLLFGSLYGIYITSHQSYRRSVNKAELNQNARISLERITRDLRQTEKIVTSLPPDDTDPLNPPPSAIHFQDGHNTTQIQYIKYLLDSNNLKKQVIHYYFTSDPTTWVTWNAQDQYGNPPEESIDEDVIKADKITSLKFYGEKLITIELVAADSESSYSFKTEVLGRNIQ